MTIFTLVKRILALLIAFAIIASHANAQDAASYYKGKVVHFVVGIAVGGGFDAYARMIAPYLAKELGSTVIVENQVGAGGLLALNRMYAGSPDGLRLLIVNGTPATLGQLLERENHKYDLMKFDHLGIISAYPWIWLAGPKSGILTLEDALKPGALLRWGGTAPGDGPMDGAALTCQALQLNCKIVSGYRGSAEIALAMERGEVDLMYISDSSAANYVKSGSARALAAMARNRSELLPDARPIYEQLKLTPEQQWWFDFRGNLNDLGRMLVTTGGTPPERIAFLRAAMKRALTNPELIAEGEKSQRGIKFQPPEEVLELVKKTLTAITPEQKKQIRDAVERY